MEERKRNAKVGFGRKDWEVVRRESFREELGIEELWDGMKVFEF